MEDPTESMEMEPGEIIENSISEQDKDDVLSIYVGEDAQDSFPDSEPPVRLEKSSDLKTDHREKRLDSSRDSNHFRSKKFYSFNTRGRRFVSNNRFRRPSRTFNFSSRNGTWRREPKKIGFLYKFQPRRLCRPLVFCSTNEGYTLTNGSRWHTSKLVSLDSWIDDVFDAIQYLTDNACCQSNHPENNLIVYVPDDLSWRRMNDVINQYKNYWACTVSLRKLTVEMRGSTRWIPHHRDMAERMLQELTH